MASLLLKVYRFRWERDQSSQPGAPASSSDSRSATVRAKLTKRFLVRPLKLPSCYAGAGRGRNIVYVMDSGANSGTHSALREPTSEVANQTDAGFNPSIKRH